MADLKDTQEAQHPEAALKLRQASGSLLGTQYLRVTRTIVIEGPADWVRDIHDRSWCPAVGVGGLRRGGIGQILCTAASVAASNVPLVTEI